MNKPHIEYFPQKGPKRFCIKNYNLNFPDNQLDDLPLLQVVQSLENLIDEIQPEIIYTHSPDDLNIDHQITFKATLTACRPIPKTSVLTMYAFEVLSSSEWNFGHNHTFMPNHFVDITEFFEKKVEAIQCYEEELRPQPHARCIENVRSLAGFRGMSIGVQYAEAFN